MNSQKNWRKSWKDDTKANKLTIVLLIAYLIALCWILLFKLSVRFSYMANRKVNLVPFREFFFYGKMDLGEIIMNVVIFVPLGIYAGILFNNWSAGKQFFLFFVTSLIIEACQFILAIGAFDSTDVITNTVGGIIGWLLFKGIEKVFNNSIKAQKIINIIAVTATVVMIVFLVLLKTNHLGIRYQ